jgi:hypothetical protein
MDFEIGHEWHLNDGHLRLFGGVRAMRSEEKNRYMETPAVAYDLSGTFHGAGPLVGIEGAWHLDKAGTFAVVGGFSGSASFGQRNDTLREETVGLPFVREARSTFDTVGRVAGSVGLAVEISHSSSLTFGYRVEYEINSFSKETTETPWGEGSRNLLTHIPFLKLETHF